MGKLTRDFYARDTLTAARELLGRYVVRRQADGGYLCGRICETEAYIGRMDKACHAYNYKRTPRTETLFAPPVTAYLYLIYGMYHCLNFVTEEEGEPCAVLIRGLEPAGDVQRLALFRYGIPLDKLSAYQKKHFLDGPGKVCKALDLTRAQNGLDLTGDELFVWDAGDAVPDFHTSRRIGIDYAEEAVDFPWRFYF